MTKSTPGTGSVPIKAMPGTERFFDAVLALMNAFKAISEEGKAMPTPHSEAVKEIGASCVACALRIERAMDLKGAPR